MKTTLTLLLSLLVVSSCRQMYMKNGTTPDYNDTYLDGDYEIRRYNSTTWLRTIVEGFDFGHANGKLNSFIEAQGEPKGKFKNYWPVLINHTNENEVWLSWFIPPGVQLSSVNSASVDIFVLPPTTFHVLMFSGFPSIVEGQKKAKELLSRILISCSNLGFTEYYGAGYEPLISAEHHLEVWIKEKPC